MYTTKSRLLSVYRGEHVDALPYVPRLDLWYLANSVGGTLPPQHAARTQNEIARAEGWPLYFRVADDLLAPEHQQGYLHRGIGLYHNKETLYDIVLPRELEVVVTRRDGRIRVEYHTPVGMVSSTTHYDVGTQKLGITIPPHIENLIRSPDDYRAACWLFEHLDLVPNYARYESWVEDFGDDGLAVALGFYGASPFNQIQRDLIDPTLFFFHYSDHYRLMRELADRLEPLFDKMLRIVCDSPAEVIMWGANFDDMITYPPYFEKEITPWLRKASDAFAAAGKRLMCHTDGENEGLMDLIRDSGIHVAESICPAPMTKLSLAEYYRRWSPALTLVGGVPSTIVLPETSEADFEAYLDELFRAVAPGWRMIVGVADQVPPNAVFSRLQRIGERVEREGRLPLAAGAFRPQPAVAEAARTGPAAESVAATKPARAPAEPAGSTPGPGAATRPDGGGVVTAPPADELSVGVRADDAPPDAVAVDDELFDDVRADVLDGDHVTIREHVAELLARGVRASDILDRGLISAIDVVGKRMASGEAFIHEVLLGARAMSAAVSLLEPHLASSGEQQRGKVLIGTVAGDMHDIGKNLVVTMLKGVGFEVRDLGINVPRDRFVQEVQDYQPDVLGLSALLTTTMLEIAQVIGALDERGLRRRCKVIVGGAPVSESFAMRIGADGFAPGAVEAVQLVKSMLAAPAAETRSAVPAAPRL
jgi:methylmalonyl-CoA mutase cobalamin-binding domain/chain